MRVRSRAPRQWADITTGTPENCCIKCNGPKADKSNELCRTCRGAMVIPGFTNGDLTAITVPEKTPPKFKPRGYKKANRSFKNNRY